MTFQQHNKKNTVLSKIPLVAKVYQSFFHVLRHEKIMFFKRWCQSPMRIGALAPTPESVTRFIAQYVTRRCPQPIVVDLGAGTGVFSEKLIAQGVPGKNIYAVELDKELYQHLRRAPSLSGVSCIHGNAAQLSAILPQKSTGHVDFVVTSLPFSLMPHATVVKILEECACVLSPHGTIVRFGYCLGHKKKLPFLIKTLRRFGAFQVWNYQSQSSHQKDGKNVCLYDV